MKTYIFKVNKNNYYLNIIYCSIDINDIENYLKRIENLKNSKNKNIELIFIPNKKIYNLKHLLWGLFIAKNKFLEQINISKSLWIESILIFNYTDQINKIQEEWYLQEGVNKNIFFILLTKEKINKKQITEIKEKLNIKEKDSEKIKFNTKQFMDFYKVTKPDIENKILEKIS